MKAVAVAIVSVLHGLPVRQHRVAWMTTWTTAKVISIWPQMMETVRMIDMPEYKLYNDENFGVWNWIWDLKT